MRKIIVVLLVMLTMSVNLVFDTTTSFAQMPKPIKDKVAIAYDSLSLMSISDRKEFYTELAPELKSNLWKVHLRLYLSKHPEFTDRQRQSVERLVAFIKPQLFTISQDSPDWFEKVGKPVKHLAKGISAVFTGNVVKELLAILGSPEPLPASVSLYKPIKYKPIKFLRGLMDNGCNRNAQISKSLLVAGVKPQPQRLEPQTVRFMKIVASSKPGDCACGKNKEKPVIKRKSPVDPCDCNENYAALDCPAGDFECDSNPCSPRAFCGWLWLFVCNGECIWYPCSC